MNFTVSVKTSRFEVAERGLADVAGVDGDHVGHLRHAVERGAEHLADLAQPLPLQPGAAARQILQRLVGQRDEVRIGAQRRPDGEPLGLERPLAALIVDQQPAQRRRGVGGDHLVLLPERVHRDVGQVREAAHRLRLALGEGLAASPARRARSPGPASARRCGR